MIIEAVVNALLPVLKEMKTNFNNLTVLYNDLNEKVCNPNTPLPTTTPLSPTTPLPTATPDSPLYRCGGTGGWRRVVYLNMTDPTTTNCPTGWQLTTHSKRTCGRLTYTVDNPICDSVFFSVSGGEYTRVCGSIRAYQYDEVQAFEAYDDGDVTSIDGPYCDGIILTHGNPRQHIWTFAAGRSESWPFADSCPCDVTRTIDIPSFVGGDYFCESGVSSGFPRSILYPDPLWDGDGCISTSTCCEFNNPPYFTKQLSSPTTDDIEARLCIWDDNSDIPIEFIELYVQ